MSPPDRAAPAAEESLRGLVDALADEAQGLLRAELRLARSELVATLRRAAWLIAGAVVAVVGLGYLVGFALAILIAWRGNHTLVAGIVAGVWLLVVGAGALVAWRHRHLAPLALTRASLRDDVEWARAQTKRARP
ncbi:MAG TPA: phage holin family protein [Verrucomicrobiae bacterium]|nr:phage holin family protein [Verrucomicrobiae bacterium]